MFNLKPLACLVTEPPGVSCWSLLVTGSCPLAAARQCAAVSSAVLWQRTSFYTEPPSPVSCAATLAPCRPAHRDQHDDTPQLLVTMWAVRRHHAVPRPPLLGAGRAAAAGHRPLDPGGLAPASGLGVLLVRHPVSRSVSSTHSWFFECQSENYEAHRTLWQLTSNGHLQLMAIILLLVDKLLLH